MFFSENLSSINIIGCDDKFDGQKSLMNMFYWIDGWSLEDQAKVKGHAQIYVTDENTLNYFLFILEQSSKKINAWVIFHLNKIYFTRIPC